MLQDKPAKKSEVTYSYCIACSNIRLISTIIKLKNEILLKKIFVHKKRINLNDFYIKTSIYLKIQTKLITTTSTIKKTRSPLSNNRIYDE